MVLDEHAGVVYIHVCAGEQAAYAEDFLAHLLDDEFLAAYLDI